MTVCPTLSPSLPTTLGDGQMTTRRAVTRHLVLTHLVPGPSNAIARRLFLDGATFDGTLTLGTDGMEFVLPPK